MSSDIRYYFKHNLIMHSVYCNHSDKYMNYQLEYNLIYKSSNLLKENPSKLNN